jgi:hypothetical protein
MLANKEENIETPGAKSIRNLHLSPSIQDKMEKADQQCFNMIEAFAQRCADVITFMELISKDLT